MLADRDGTETGLAALTGLTGSCPDGDVPAPLRRSGGMAAAVGVATSAMVELDALLSLVSSPLTGAVVPRCCLLSAGRVVRCMIAVVCVGTGSEPGGAGAAVAAHWSAGQRLEVWEKHNSFAIVACLTACPNFILSLGSWAANRSSGKL